MKQYKAVAGPKNINVGKGDTQSAFNTFAEIINREATGGWEYHSIYGNHHCNRKTWLYAATYPYELLYVNFCKRYVICYFSDLMCEISYIWRINFETSYFFGRTTKKTR